MGLFKRSKPRAQSDISRPQRTTPHRSPLDAPLQLITGKGGVGRTTVALNLGRAYAERGLSTLVLEVRDAESELGEESSYRARADSMLGRAAAQELNQTRPYQLGPDPLEIASRLWAAQLVAPVGHEWFLRTIIPSGRLARAALESKGLSRFLRSAPSMHELGVYYHLARLQSDERFDRIIVDLPASGHTLALTELPERIARILRRGALVDALREGVGRIADPTYTALWVTTLPEELPVSEALELAEALESDGVTPAGVILNRALARELSDAETMLLKKTLERADDTRDGVPQSSPSQRAIESTICAALLERDLRARLARFKHQWTLPELADASARVQHIERDWFSTST